MQAVDYMFRAMPTTLAALRAEGVTAVARYLDPYNLKGLTAIEARELLDAGFDIHLVYETTGGAPGFPVSGAQYFTRAQGGEDSRRAEECLAAIGAPDGVVVYYAVDTNIEPSAVTEYFNGVADAATQRQVPGVYGYQRMCEYAFANYSQIGKHLWGTYPQQLTVPYDLVQHEQRDIGDITCDVNEAFVRGWHKETDMTADDVVKAIEAKYDLANTITAIKDLLTRLVHANVYGTKIFVAPVDGAELFGMDSLMTTVGWKYPDGSTHFFKDGAEVGAK